VIKRTRRPVESHSGARGNILAEPQIFLLGPFGEKVLEFFFFKWYILAYFIVLADGGAPKRREAWDNLPPPHPHDAHAADAQRKLSEK